VLARTWPDGANIGVGCRASGVIGLDLDRHDGGPDGVAVFAALCRVYGQPWPDTLTVATPHDGRHLYFGIPPGTAAASTISRWPGIDIRARLPDRRLPRWPRLGRRRRRIRYRPRRPRRSPPPLAGQPAHQPRAGSVTPAPTSRSPPSLDDEFTHNGEVMSLRLIYLHMIEEYARHLGHAGLLREQIDGATGE
jgi:Bifunctional DNA primase/polymerase, N-terminal/Protein of unknown function (DUF664)